MRRILPIVLLLACSRGEVDDKSAVTQSTARAVASGDGLDSALLRPCGLERRSNVTGQGIGEIQIGRKPEAIALACTIARDTTALGAEALPERLLFVATPFDTVEVTIHDNRVWRIAFERPALRTADSLGVGSTLAELLRTNGATGAEGEGVLYVLLPTHCGVSFRLGYELQDDGHRQNWNRHDLGKLPPTVRVSKVLVTGCGR